MSGPRTRVILAATALPHEAELVACASDHGLRIVRRCVDTADLLASAAAEPSAAVVLTDAVPRLTRSAVDALQAGGRMVVGVRVDADDDGRGLAALGVQECLLAGPDARRTATSIAECLQRQAPAAPSRADVSRQPMLAGGRGRVVAVWGPPGAPGRTSVAIALADALARDGSRVLLVDADMRAPSVGFALGIAEAAPGLVGACRRAEGTGFDAGSVRECARSVGAWSVITGLERSDRWPEVRGSAFDAVVAACRESYDYTVVDVGADIDPPEDAPWAQDRHAAGRSAVAHADRVVAVADSSALGAARLAEHWPALEALCPAAPTIIVRNRVHRGAPRGWSDAIAALGVRGRVHDLPARRADLEECWGRGIAPSESLRARGWARSVDRMCRAAMRG